MKRLLIPAIASISFLLTSVPATAVGAATVFYLDRNYRPVTRLDRLPTESAGLKALLALYALENGAGCKGKDEADRVRCDMTEKLGLGSNCSEAHLELVRAWFVKIPNLTSRWNKRWNATTATPHALERLCYRQPNSASWHNVWEIIRVKATGTDVEVEGILSWGSQYGHGRVRYKNSYRIEAKRIVETSAQTTELSRSDKSIFAGSEK